MLSRQFKCRTCGKEYLACPDCEQHGLWRAVACTFECYQKYVDAVLEARGESVEEPTDVVEDISETDKKSKKK